jgi:uncharacterized protein YndB with AHSA1/START domain
VTAIRHGSECMEDGAVVRAWLELPGVARRLALSAWTEPRLVRDWWGGELDATPEPGRDYVVRFAALDQTMRGRVLAYQPEAGLAFTWAWEQEPAAPTRQVEIRVVDVQDGARVNIWHGTFGDTEEEKAEAVGAQEGWEHFLPRLASSLAETS